MGSYVYASQCRLQRQPIVAMLSLETMGYFPALDPPNEGPATLRGWLGRFQGDFVAVVGNFTSRRLTGHVTQILRDECSFPTKSFSLPGLLPGVKSSDHWAFWKHGYPACMVTDTAHFRYPYYHTAKDTPGKLSYRALGCAAHGLARVVTKVAIPRET